MATLIDPRTELERIQTEPSGTPLSPSVAWLTSVMDDSYQIPGTNIRLGWDALIGLIPGVGDLVTAVIGSMILREAKRLGVSPWTRARMVGNYALDMAVGAIPLAGDVFDVAFKAHRKNLRLLQKHIEKEQRRHGASTRFA